MTSRPGDPLTDRQQEVLDTIVSMTAQDGYPPTLRELGEALGIRSTNGVADHLAALQRKGRIERRRHASRTIRVINQEQVTLTVRVEPVDEAP
jgi:repressor LexA